jgi:2-keto-4-pentenoate hydratase/2-oxohepta-3-ene-1,7-dioic acid hydratase in catechol pathway
MNPHVNFGAHDVIPMPPHTQALDFELEVAALILKKASDVSLDEASRFIAGYTIFNDWSARDIQGHEMRVGLGPSKGKDFANTFGPWLTTPDELEQYREGDRLNLEMTASVNGVPLGTDSLKNMSWSFEELLVHASRASVVGKGDVLASGTSSGGSLSEIWSRTGVREPKPLQVGDVVEMTVTGLGTIRNVIGEVTSPGHLVGKARRTYSEEEL